mgnify:FL=1
MSQHGGQWRHSRSRNKRLFTMNIPPASLPRLLPVWAGLLLAAFSGILMACAFIPVDWSGCVWIGFLPLLTALWYGRRREGKRGILAYALYGWVFGVVFYGISFWWVNEVSTLGYIPLMIFYGGLFPGLWALVMGVFFRPDARPLPDAKLAAKERRAAWKAWAMGDILPSASAALAGAALWVCLEWGRGWLIPGFGWNNLGVALYGNPLAQWAEYFGVTALAFIPAVFSVWLWRVCRRAGTMIVHEGRRTVPWDFFILVAVLLTMFVVGVCWTARYSPQSAAVTGNGRLTVPVMAVQLNLSQKEKWDPANRGSIYRALLDMTEQGMLDLQNRALEQAVKNGAEASLDMPAWVIWPESSFPISTFYRDSTGERFPNQDNVNFLSAEEDYVQALRNGICNFILLTGTDDIYLSDEGRVARAYNCLTVFEGDYSTARPHAKAMLVPFGEYIPMRETFPFLEKAFEASAGTAMGLNYTPGCSSSPVPVPIRPGSSVTVGVIPLVCFEDVVGSWVRRFIRQEPQLMVNVTNDGWFNRSCANEQHWRNAAFRCIELRRAMVRAANTGVSVALAPNGAVIADLRDSSGSPFTRGVMAATLPVGCTEITLYAMLGDWAVLVCFLVFAALLLRRIDAGKRVHGPVENGVYRRSTGATPR